MSIDRYVAQFHIPREAFKQIQGNGLLGKIVKESGLLNRFEVGNLNIPEEIHEAGCETIRIYAHGQELDKQVRASGAAEFRPETDDERMNRQALLAGSWILNTGVGNSVRNYPDLDACKPLTYGCIEEFITAEFAAALDQYDYNLQELVDEGARRLNDGIA